MSDKPHAISYDAHRPDAATFAELIDRRAEATPDATMLIDVDESVTFAEFRDRADRVANALATRGVGPGTAVAWQLPNQIGTVVVFAALAVLDARQSPLLMGFRQRDLSRFFSMTRPELVITVETWRGVEHTRLASESLDQIDSDTPVIDLSVGVPAVGTGWHPRGNADSPRFIYSTSGSSGAPKLVQHTDRSLLAWATAQARVQDVTSDDVNAAISPLAHIGGGLVLGQCLSTGCAALLVDGYDADTTPELMSRHRTSIITTVPTVLMSLVDVQRSRRERLFPELRFCVGGAAPKPPSLHRDIQEHLGGRGLLMAYGMTEAGSIGVPNPGDTDEQLEVTVGVPLPGLALKVVGDGDGRSLATGEVGEIRVKGPSITPGYIDAAYNERAFDEDGYLRTGDLGRLRSDGRLEVVGRLKDIIIRKGENISPREIEDVLFAMDDVSDVAVVGVADDELGERVCAVVVPRTSGTVTLERIVDHCRASGVMMQKVPQQLELVEALPRTVLGKVDKLALRRSLGSR